MLHHWRQNPEMDKEQGPASLCFTIGGKTRRWIKGRGQQAYASPLAAKPLKHTEHGELCVRFFSQ
jgi:hypothetical protein